MSTRFRSPLSSEFDAFLKFKRSLGFRYNRAEFTLREFDCFIQAYAAERKTWRLDQAMLAFVNSIWPTLILSFGPPRMPIVPRLPPLLVTAAEAEPCEAVG
jgi:hypothetical protein